jgi:hypothetical protein
MGEKLEQELSHSGLNGHPPEYLGTGGPASFQNQAERRIQ